jgi:transcriptional regulator with GAF, ATPase, and Fis domain
MARFSLYIKQVSDMESLREKVQEIEKEEIINALKDCKWIMSRAARKLGITERMIGYKVKKYKIQKKEGYTKFSIINEH